MNDLVESLKDEIKHNLLNLKASIGALKWISNEYSNYMMVGRDAYAECLEQFIKENPEGSFAVIAQMLLLHIGKYGSTQAIYRAANEILSECADT
jgi:hypothetical protein